MEVLVAFATAHGSTQGRCRAHWASGSAERRASTQQSARWPRCKRSKGSMQSCSGSAVHNGNWLGPAVEFVKRPSDAAHRHDGPGRSA